MDSSAFAFKTTLNILGTYSIVCGYRPIESDLYSTECFSSTRTFLRGPPVSNLKRGIQPANCNTSNDHVFSVYKQLTATNAQQQKKQKRQDYNNSSSNTQKENKNEKPLCAFTSNNAHYNKSLHSNIKHIYKYCCTSTHTASHTNTHRRMHGVIETAKQQQQHTHTHRKKNITKYENKNKNREEVLPTNTTSNNTTIQFNAHIQQIRRAIHTNTFVHQSVFVRQQQLFVW